MVLTEWYHRSINQQFESDEKLKTTVSSLLLSESSNQGNPTKSGF